MERAELERAWICRECVSLSHAECSETCRHACECQETLNFAAMQVKYVRLSSSVDAEEHKRPVEKGWQEKPYGIDAALAWINEGYGVGLALHMTQGIAVIDIDEDTESARAFVDACGADGALVFRTLRGYHVLVRKTEALKEAKSVTLRYKNIDVCAEVYTGASSRSIVLPIARTPRARLGGHAVWVAGQRREEVLILLDLEQALAQLPALQIEVVERVQGKESTEVKELSDWDAWRVMFGEGWATLSQKAALEKMTSAAVELGRHNAVYHTARYWGYRRWDKKRLFNAARRLFTEGDVELKDDAAELWRTIDDGYEKGEQYEKPKSARGRASTIDALREAMPGAQWTTFGGKRYILHNSFAIDEDSFRGYADTVLKVPVSVESIKGLYSSLAHAFPKRHKPTLISESMLNKDGKSYIPYRVTDGEQNETVVITIQADTQKDCFLVEEFAQGNLPEGVFLDFGAFVERDVTREVLDELKRRASEENPSDLARGWVARVVKQLADYFTNDREDVRISKALLMIASVVGARAILMLVGPSGSGKTSLSKILQTGVLGEFSNVHLEDPRDLVATAGSARVIGIDETAHLEAKIQDAIKSIVSSVPLKQRKLHTNSATHKINFDCSFVFSTTSMDDLQPDLARRAVIMEIPVAQGRSFIKDEQLHKNLEKKSAALGMAFGVLAAIANQDDSWDGGDPFAENLFEAPQSDLPAFLAQDSKADLARSFWNLCKAFRISEEAALEAWDSSRKNAIKVGLGEWQEVIERAERDETLRADLENGMFVSEIHDRCEFAGDKEERRKTIQKMSKRITAMQGVLPLIGWSMHYEKRRHGGRWRVFVRLMKLSSSSFVKNDREDKQNDDKYEMPF